MAAKAAAMKKAMEKAKSKKWPFIDKDVLMPWKHPKIYIDCNSTSHEIPKINHEGKITHRERNIDDISGVRSLSVPAINDLVQERLSDDEILVLGNADTEFCANKKDPDITAIMKNEEIMLKTSEELGQMEKTQREDRQERYNGLLGYI